ncbi:MAG: hypothetical protein R2754_14855 [Microthrixaceae bacterium]
MVLLTVASVAAFERPLRMSTSSSNVVLKFAIVDGAGRSSAVWRMWTGKKRPSDDTYLAPLSHIRSLKISLHKDGWCQLGPDKRVRDMSSQDDRRAFSRWKIETTQVPRVLAAITFRRDQLRSVEVPAEATQVELIAGEQGMIVFVIVLSDVAEAVAMETDGARLIGYLDREAAGIVAAIGIPLLEVADVSGRVVQLMREASTTWKMPGTSPEETPFGWLVGEADPSAPFTLHEVAPDLATPELRSRPLREFHGSVEAWENSPLKASCGEADLMSHIPVRFSQHVGVLVRA